MPFRFDYPSFLLLLLLAVPIVWLGRHNLSTIDPLRRRVATALRLMVLLILVLMLSEFSWVQQYNGLTVIAVVDRSESVRRFVQPPKSTGDVSPTNADDWIENWILHAAKEHEPDDKLGLVTYDGRPTVRSMPGPTDVLDAATLLDPIDGTDTASSIRLAMAMYGPHRAKRMLLVTDGNDTTDSQDVLAAAEEAAGAGIIIDVLPLTYTIDREVILDQIVAPSEAREGQNVAVRVVLRSTRRSTGKLHAKHDGESIDLNGFAEGTAQTIQLDDWSIESQSAGTDSGQYVLVRVLSVPVKNAGVNQFEAIFEPDKKDDQLVANNRAETFTLVRGKGRVLVLDNTPNETGLLLSDSLKSRGFEADVMSPQAIPTTLSQLARYDAIILQNVPAEMVTPTQQKMIRQYVERLGGGMLMLGGYDSFGAGGWTNTVIDDILPVDCEIPEKKIAPIGALVLVIDQSGSMGGAISGAPNVTRNDIATEAAALSITTLFPQDLVGVVAFDTDADWAVPLQKVDNPKKHFEAIKSIGGGGGTNIYVGLNAALNALIPVTRDKASVKHILLLSDGQTPDADWAGLTQKMRQYDISLSTVGIGEADAALLTRLAQMGDGNYYAVPDFGDLPSIFIKEARTIRKHLIRKQPFVPGMRAGSPITAGMTGVPQLDGFVLTGRRKDPRVFTPLIGPEGEPIFAHWQVGLGRTAAFTSDATNQWGARWIGWSGFGDFWTSVMRFVGRPTASLDYEMSTSFEGQKLRIHVESVSNDVADVGTTIESTIIQPDGSTKIVKLQQTGAGVYEASTPAQELGSYVAHLMITRPDGERHTLFGGTTRKAGPELRRFVSNRTVLQRIAEITGGRMYDTGTPQTDSLFKRDETFEPSRSIRPLWRKLLVLLLVLLMIDIAARRIAWNEMGLGGLTTAIKRPQPQPAIQTATAISEVYQPPTPPVSTPTPADPVIESAEPEPAPKPQAKPKPVRTTDATTSRLLSAKRRARDRLSDDTDISPPTDRSKPNG